jgi:hypothetical protein
MTFMHSIYNYIPERNQVSRVYVYHVSSCSVVTVYGTCGAIFRDKRPVLLHEYFQKYMCGAQYCCLSVVT